MTFRRHQIPQILGQIKEVLEKNIIENPYLKPTYHVAQWFKDNNIKPTIKLNKYEGIDLYKFDIDVLPMLEYEQIEQLQKYLLQFDDIIGHKVRVIQLCRTGAHWIHSFPFKDIPQSIPTIEQIPDQLFINYYLDETYHYEIDNIQLYINQLFQQLSKKEEVKKEEVKKEYQFKPTYHIAQWFKDHNIQLKIQLHKFDNANYYCYNTQDHSQFQYDQMKQLQQYLCQFDDIFGHKAESIYFNHWGGDVIYTRDFTNPPQIIPTIEQIPDQLFIDFYYDKYDKKHLLYDQYQQYLDYLFQQLKKEEPKKEEHKIYIANKQLLVIDDKLITLVKKYNGKLYASKPFKITSLQEHFGEEYAKQFQEINIFELVNMILCDCINREVIEKLLTH